jgi:hypothetical protein
MKENTIYRIILDLLIFLCVTQGWWFVFLPLGILGVWYFPYFIEIVVAGVIFDSLFGFIPDLNIIGYANTIISSFLLLFISGVRRIVR